MTVKELREALTEYPDNMRVLINGYEDGLEDIIPDKLRKVLVQLNCHDSEMYGEHEEVKNVDKCDEIALLIKRYSN